MSVQTLSGPALGGLTAGTLREHGLQIIGNVGVSGLGMPTQRSSLKDRVGNGQIGGGRYLNLREVRAGLGTDNITILQQLQAAMAPRPNPRDTVALIITGLGYDGARRLYVRPDTFEYTVDQTATAANWWQINAAWIAENDPIIFSDDQDVHIFGAAEATDGLGTSPGAYFDVPVNNAGMQPVRDGRAFELVIEAHGTVTKPYIHIEGGTREATERITWHITMTDGQQLATDENLTTRVGAIHVNGKGRSGSSPFLCWPRLMPGDQVIRVGCVTGTISGSLKTRSAWY